MIGDGRDDETPLSTPHIHTHSPPPLPLFPIIRSPSILPLNEVPHPKISKPASPFPQKRMFNYRKKRKKENHNNRNRAIHPKSIPHPFLLNTKSNPVAIPPYIVHF
jgi:hypothetical protein